MPAGSSRDERLDPFALPLRFEVADRSGDERVQLVELQRERVVLRRAWGGAKTVLELPVASYLGVAIRLEPPTHSTTGAVVLVLEHPDPRLSLPLCRTRDLTDIIAEWQTWGHALRLPLLVGEADGGLRAPLGAVAAGPPIARRRRRTARTARRTARRRRSVAATAPVVHRGEREIIART
jgi:Family of unknown function (DUF6101)